MDKKFKEWENSTPAFDFNDKFVYQQIKRNKQKVFLTRILQVCACCFALIFVLTNTSPAYIKATKNIPLLNALNELFNLNKSMYTAIENDYIQEMNITKEENGIKVDIDYMVMDEKSIYLFYQVTKDGQRLKYTPEEYQASIDLLMDGFTSSCELEVIEEYDIIHFNVLSFEEESKIIEEFDFIIDYQENEIIIPITVDQSKISKRIWVW